MSVYSDRMSKLTPIKALIIKKILDYANGEHIRVVDIGCGTGDISKELSKHGIWCTAIDKDFLGVEQEETEYYHPIQGDIIEMVDYFQYGDCLDYDVILFSSSLHEIPNAMEVLKRVIKHNKKPVKVIISEPLANGSLITVKMRKILDSLYEKRTKENKVHRDLMIEYLRSAKIQSDIFYDQDVYLQMLNCAFLEVYGKSSRKREMG